MNAPESTPAVAQRPALALAVALALGSLAGPLVAGAGQAWAPALGVAAGLALGLALGLLSGGAPRAALAALLVALALVQAARTPQRPPRAQPGALYSGRLEPLREGSGSLLARLDDARAAGLLFELPAGAARAGELLRLRPGAEATRPVRAPWSRAEGLGATLRVQPDELERLAPAGAGAGLRAALRARCRRLGDEWSRGLAAALLLGERGGLSSEQGDLFARVGLRHLLAVSGMHAALFAALLLWPLCLLLQALLARLFPRRAAGDPRVLRALLMCVGLLLYAPIAGGAPPVRRAALAGALACLAPLVAGRGGLRPVDGLSLWGAALAAELALDVGALGAVGLQLSYCAALALILGTRPLERRLLRALAPLRRARLERRGWTRLPGLLALRVGRTLRLALIASVVASLGTLPLVAWHFGEWSPWGILLTPLALLLVAWLLPAGWLGLALPGSWAAQLFDPAAGWLLALAGWADALPGTPDCVPVRPFWLAGIALVCGLAGLRLRRAWPWSSLGWSAAALWLLPWCPAPSGLELVAVDVGHGTAVLLRAPGAGVWVFDAGTRDRSRIGRAGLGPVLARWEAVRPQVVLSHGDRDHLSGLDWLVERYPPRGWWGALPAPLGERLPHDARRLDLPWGVLEQPLGSQGGFTLLRAGPADDNEGSRALAVHLGATWVVLCGDAEDEGLAGLIELWRPPGTLQMLLLPHHGSHSPWLGELLDAWRPVEAWISSAERPAVAAELDRRGLPWRCTALEGPLEGCWTSSGRAPGTEPAFSPPAPQGVRSEDAGSSQDAVRPRGSGR